MRNGLGVTALVLGLLGMLFGLIPILGVIAFPLGVFAIIFGFVGMRRASKGQADNKGMAIAGLITGVLAVILAIIGLAIVNHAVHQLDEDLNQMTIWFAWTA